MTGAYAGKLLFVNLSEGTMEEKVLSEDLAKNFIGGYGIGAEILYKMMKPGADPLGPGNVLGFISGLLNGTGAMFAGRYTVVCKSPVTGGWNDANSGGYFGPELKKAGFDAVFVSGVSEKPVYILIRDGKAEIRDAAGIWGKDSVETLDTLIRETGETGLRAALIGPAGEKQSLISCIMNDKHRAAGRGGCGAVMGSKKLKALAVTGKGEIPVADLGKIKEVNYEIIESMKKGPAVGMIKEFGRFGTGRGAGGSALNGDSPVKNWGGVGIVDMGKESAERLSTFTYDERYNKKRYACASCPLACGAHYQVDSGKWPVGETDRPEYETLAAFGTMTLNDDIEAIIKCNDICNKYGMDTISAGATVAWAMECYENGIFTKEDTGGVELSWGNAEAMVEMTQAMADQTGFGKILALGSAGAAEKLGKGMEFLQTARGIELPMHDPRFSPGFARTYQFDPTPGRHVKGGLGVAEMRAPAEIRYHYEGRGQKDMAATFRTEINNASGLCVFGNFSMPRDAAIRFISAATGWEFTEEDLLRAGKRIFHMRHAFNLREGQNPMEIALPKRSIGDPPQDEGPLKGITVDIDSLREQFFENIGWDKEKSLPTLESLKTMGAMDDVIRDLYGQNTQSSGNGSD